METSVERDFWVTLEHRAIKSARIHSAPSTPAPTSIFDQPKPSSCPKHIETDLERIFRQSFEQESIDQMKEIPDGFEKRSTALVEYTSSSSTVPSVDGKQLVPDSPSPWELLLHLTLVLCFALFMGVVGNFKQEVPLAGRFLLDIVAAVLGTMWDLVNFPLQLWFDPRETALCFAFNTTEAIVYRWVFSTATNVIFFDLTYNVINDQLARVENLYHIGVQTKMIFESFCFNAKTAINGYQEAYDKMVPLLQHDPTEGQAELDGKYPFLDKDD